MKRLVLTVVILFSSVFLINGQDEYNPAIAKATREARDISFRNPQISPLGKAYFASFDGLKYFPIDGNYSVKAVFNEDLVEKKSFKLPTSTGSSALYLKIGVLTFTLNNTEFALNAYRRDYSNNPNYKPTDDSLFVPFKDLTSGVETYGTGRFLYVNRPKGKDALIDFNLAYNPSCAYGDESFSCPIPPKENFLKVEIKAGEKIYK